MTTAQINPQMLSWAIDRSGLAVAELAGKLKVNEDKLGKWQRGEKSLTFRQAQAFAAKTHVPFGYLFLPKPPVEKLPLPDLRTVGGSVPNRPSAELIDIIKIVMQRQEWYREYQQENLMQPNALVGSKSLADGVTDMVAALRSALGVEPHPKRGKWEDYYRDLVNRIEQLGILVMREGYIGHWSRPLNVEEFRGFAIADAMTPVIFINHADEPYPRLFTLIHELCHIFLGQSGVSDGAPGNHRQEEQFCNAVAGEFLVPAEEFERLWQTLDSWQDNLPPLEKHFHVSTWVIARRALDLGKISSEQYQRYIAGQIAAYRNREKGKGGLSYYATKHIQQSDRFAKAVVSEALAGKLLLREAGQLLDMKPNNISKLARELGV